RAVTHCCNRIRPVPHEHRIAVLKSETRFFLMPGQDVERSDTRAIELVAHELERAHCFRTIDDHFPFVIDNLSAEGAQVFDEAGDEAFITRALRDDPVPRSAAA